MVYTDSHCGAVSLAKFKERSDGTVDFFNLGSILLIGVAELAECAARIHEVTGINAHLVGHLGGGKGSLGIEVNVGDKGHVATLLTKSRTYHADVLGLAHSLGRKPHVIGSGIGDSAALRNRSLGVDGRCVGHRLQAYGVVAT